MSDFIPDVKEKTSKDVGTEVTEPTRYKVLLHNDNYTTMDFVTEVLIFVFNKTRESAIQIMLSVHKQGIGVCGIYTFEVAETKVHAVHTMARERGFPLKCTMEKA